MVRRTWVFACLVDQPTTHSIFAIVFSIVYFFTGNRPGPWVSLSNPGTKIVNFSYFQKFYYNFLNFFHFFSLWPQDSGRKPVYLHTGTPKINRYACYESPRRLSFRPNWKDLPHQSPSGSPSPRNLRIRIPGKARANKKEIGNTRFFPIFALSLLLSYRPQRYLTAPAGSFGPGFYFSNKRKR